MQRVFTFDVLLNGGVVIAPLRQNKPQTLFQNLRRDAEATVFNRRDAFEQKIQRDGIDMEFLLKAKGVEVVVYEPTLDTPDFYNSRVIKNLSTFKEMCYVIVANRFDKEVLGNVSEKVYMRALFGRD